MGLFDGVADILGGSAKDVMGFAGGLVGAGSSLMGGVMTNNAQKDIAQQAQQFSAQQAQQQMDFQKQMRATQYQTAVDDLKAAGLNPMLAYSQGGSGNLAGAAAIGQQAQLRNPAEGLAHSASTMANIRADLDQKEAQTVESISRVGVNDEQRKNLDADTQLKILESKNVPERTKQIISQTMLQDAQRTATHAQEAATRMDTLIRKTGDLPEAEQKGSYHKSTPYNPYYLKDITQGLNSATNAVRAIR